MERSALEYQIITVSASGTKRKHLARVFEKEQEVITASSEGCDVQGNISAMSAGNTKPLKTRITSIVVYLYSI